MEICVWTSRKLRNLVEEGLLKDERACIVSCVLGAIDCNMWRCEGAGGLAYLRKPVGGVSCSGTRKGRQLRI